MGVGSIGFWFGQSCSRKVCKLTAGVALLTAGFVGQPTVAAPQVGAAVFVGDVDVAAESAASNANLPSLSKSSATPKASTPRSSGDSRYAQQAVARTPRTSSAKPNTNSATRADFAEAVNAQIQQRQAEKGEATQSRGIFARLMPKFGRQNPASTQTAASGAPQAARPQRTTSPQRKTSGVEQASYRTNGQRGQLQMRSGGASQRQGLFSFGQKQTQTKRSAANRSSQAKSTSMANQQRRQPTTQRTQAGKSNMPGRVSVASAERSTRLPKPFTAPRTVAPVEPSPRGMVFISDEAAKPTAKTGGNKRPLIRAVKPAPIAKTNPAGSSKSTRARAAQSQTARSQTAQTKSANKANTKSGYPTAKQAAKRRGLNPVPPKSTGSAPSQRAVALLFEANQAAQTAATEQELTRVVQRCRHVLAIDNSADAMRYSHQLASWALNKRGELRADAGQNTEAMTDFADALAMDPSRWRAIHNRAVLMAQAGKYAEAFDAFNATIELNPKFAKAYSNRASLYVQAGDFRSAMVDYTKAISIDPDLPVAHKGQGRVCHMLGRMEQALQHLEAAALLAPSDASIATCRADLLVDMGRYAAATEGYRQAIAIDAGHAGAYRNLAWLQATCPDRRFQNAQEAVANAEKAIDLLDAKDDISLDTLAAAQAAGGDFKAAIATVKKALAVAAQEDQPVYTERLSLYESGQPFFSSPVTKVSQAGYERNAQ